MKDENREAFFARLEPVLSPTDLLRVEVAYALAKQAHRWQTRKELDEEGNPIRYFEHLRATALILMDECRIYEPDMVIAALMHDSLEDTRDISPRMLEYLFGQNVVRMVRLLTKNPKEGYYGRLLDHGDFPTVIIKGCDRLSNMRTLEGCSMDFRMKQREETAKVVIPFLGNFVFANKLQNVKSGYIKALSHLIESLSEI